jgi:N-acetylmuramoyl-L-alanine amidase
MRPLSLAAAAFLVLVVAATAIAAPRSSFFAQRASKDERAAPKPPIVVKPIPFGPKRKREMADYSQRHYGQHKWRLRDPKVIVEHIAVAGSTSAVFATFAPDVPDPELHELPNVCSHFVVSSDGRVVQLVPLGLMCRHTVGLNDTAIGI